MAEQASNAAATVGTRVKSLREARALSANRAAQMAGLDLSHWQRVERGAGNITLHTLIRIAVVLEVDPSDLVAKLSANDLPKGAARPMCPADWEAFQASRAL